MHQQPQYPDNTRASHFIPGLNGHRDSGDHKITGKINSRLDGNKACIDYEMMETFYYRLFPVTYCNWKCKQ